MNLKNATVRSIVIVAILIVSVMFGIIFQKLKTDADIKKYPVEYSEFVTKYSEEYAVPEYIIYTYIKNESDFDSSLLSEDGKIGLMQVSPETLEEYKGTLHDSYDTGMLYDPETNIKYGTYKLSRAYVKLGTWKAVFASDVVGIETVLEWLDDESISDIEEKRVAKLRDIPDKTCAKYVESMDKIAEKYKALYYDN